MKPARTVSNAATTAPTASRSRPNRYRRDILSGSDAPSSVAAYRTSGCQDSKRTTLSHTRPTANVRASTPKASGPSARVANAMLPIMTRALPRFPVSRWSTLFTRDRKTDFSEVPGTATPSFMKAIPRSRCQRFSGLAPGLPEARREAVAERAEFPCACKSVWRGIPGRPTVARTYAARSA